MCFLLIIVDPILALVVGTSLGVSYGIIFYFVNNFIGKTLLDTSGGNINPDTDIQKYIDLYTKENIDLNNLIFDYYSLDEINNAFNTIEKSKDFFGRGVILFD